MVVDEGRDGVLEGGEGDVAETNPPHPPPQLTLPQWLLKALGPSFAAARKATLVPWLAHALQQGCTRDQLLFSGASHAHITLEWVFRRLLSCPARRHAENKGTWRRHSVEGAPSPWQAPQPSAREHQRGIAELAQLVRRPAKCAVRDRILPCGPPAFGHAGMVPPRAAGEGGPLCGPVECCAGFPTPRV